MEEELDNQKRFELYSLENAYQQKKLEMEREYKMKEIRLRKRKE
jgi:hypothetical protein